MIFAISFAALYAAHMVGDHLVQRHEDAVEKGAPGTPGRIACAGHVLSLTAVKLLFLGVALWATGQTTSVLAWVVALGLDAASHYWADRAAYHPAKTSRVTLERLAHRIGKDEFWALGKSAVDAEGRPAPSLGTGSYAMDQSFHIAALFVAAILLEVLP